jgi:glycine/D-amino acid oxidase-like deaminating enzyme
MADALVMRLSPDGTRLIFGARPRRFETDEKTAAQDLRRMICGVWPKLRSLKIEFCWTGLIGMTTNHIPHMGVHDGVHNATGCNDSGVAMMSGYQTARKILWRQNRPWAFDTSAFPAPPL